jgi:SWI/SNF-related matrix-associated actin-dependent regulator of chromatin subfamily B protein 1
VWDLRYAHRPVTCARLTSFLGKFWHRHRRPRPVQYNSDPQFHLNSRNEELGKTTTKKRGRAANSVAADGAETPSRQKSELWVEVPTRPTIPPSEDDRPVSPVSTASSVSEAPLAQQSLKTNGASQSTAAAPPRPSTPDSPRPPAAVSSSPGGDVASNARGAYSIPAWLSTAIVSLQTKYPEDKFEAILRKSSPRAMPEWRIKCLDCPGKLYNPGPGDSLSNYEVHLKNRQHRQRVSSRTEGPSS